MKALVTGAAGFVGRHMVTALVERGYEIFAVDIKSRARVHAKVTSWRGDANNVFRHEDMQYDLVVHCAYHVGGRAMIDGNSLVLAKNLQLDASMFEWAVRTKQKRVLYFSSSAAYPTYYQHSDNSTTLLYENLIEWNSPRTWETGYVTPDGRYGWAKLTGEQLAAAAQLAGLNVHVVRPFSGYGSDQSLDYPFPMFVDRVIKKEAEFVIWGSGTQTRDWIHIDDVVEGALQVVEQDVKVPVNLGTGIPTSMYELANSVMQISGHRVPIKIKPDMPMGVMHRVASIVRMQPIYYPKVTLWEGIERALEDRRGK